MIAIIVDDIWLVLITFRFASDRLGWSTEKNGMNETFGHRCFELTDEASEKMSEVIEIQTASDPRVARYTNLRSDATRIYDTDSFIAEGRWCVQRLIASQLPLHSLLADTRKADEVAKWAPPELPVFSLPAEQINRLVGYNFHRGVLACGFRPRLVPADCLHFERGITPLALAAVGIDQQENLGSMMRTAAALGIHQVFLGRKTADPFSRRAIRVSMGAVFKLRLLELPEPAEQLAALADQNQVRTVVTTLDPDATPLEAFQPDDRASVVIMGNEAEGVAPQIEAIATDRVTIPMELSTDSLNVAVAAAIVLYQLRSKIQSSNFAALD